MNPKRLRAMGEHLQAILDASERELAALHRETVRRGSLAAQEIEDAEGNSDAERDAVGEAHVQGLKSMRATFDFIGAALDLNARPERAFSHMAILRNGCEAAANVVWYLNPLISREERQSRAMTGVRDATGAARRFGQKAQITFSDQQTEALDQLDARIRAHPSQPSGSPKLQVKLREIARTLTLEDRLTDAGLEALSNCTHANKNARDEIVLNWNEEGKPVLTTHLAAEWAIWYASNLLLAAMWAAIQYFGRDPTSWVEDVMSHADDLQTALNERRAEQDGGQFGENRVSNP